MECQYWLSLRLFQIVHFQYFLNKKAVPPTSATALHLILPQQHSRLFSIVAVRGF